MSIDCKKTFTIRCDGIGCDESFSSTEKTGTQLRNEARKFSGWVYTKSSTHLDYCPECNKRRVSTAPGEFNPSVPPRVAGGWGY